MENSISSQVSFPLTRELSYLIGVLLGDGWLAIHPERRTHQFRMKSIDKDFPDKVNDCIETLTGRRGSIRVNSCQNRFGKKPQWELIVCNKALVEYLNKITLSKNIVPSFVFTQIDFQIAFLRGLMDSEGWISKNKLGYWQIGIAMCDKEIMKSFEEIAVLLNIRLGKEGKKLYPSGKTLYTRIFKKGIMFCPFTIQRKAKRFRDYRLDTLEG